MTDDVQRTPPNSSWRPTQTQAIVLSIVTLTLYSAYILSGSAEWLYQWSKSFADYEIRQHLGLSKRYLLQYGHVFFLFFLLVMSRYLVNDAGKSIIPQKFVKSIAKYTPAVFIIHFPILFFLAAMTDYDRTSSFDQVVLLLSFMALSILFGKICFFMKPIFDKVHLKLSGWIANKFRQNEAELSIREPLQISPLHSEFLNICKIVSMAAIVLGHFSFNEFTIYELPGFDGSAPRFAVPAFFMLSGYFLMLGIDRCKVNAVSLYFNRMWSLYFLIIPMLIIVPLLDNSGYAANAAIYQYEEYYVFERERGPLGVPIAVATWINSLLYLNEIWIFNLIGLSDMKGGIVAFSNDPYWFMCYLLPFTLLMIIWRMVNGIKRYVYLFFASLIIGPPILMLSPLFFAGALAYKLHKRIG